MIYERDSPEDPERDTQQSLSPLQQQHGLRTETEPNPAPSGLNIRALRPANIHHAAKQCVRREKRRRRTYTDPQMLSRFNTDGKHRGTFKHTNVRKTMFGALIASQSQ